MADTNEKVILIKGDGSKWFQQAIFVLNPNFASVSNIDFVQEAEKIISSYMSGKNKAAITTAYSATKPVQKTVLPTPAPRTKAPVIKKQGNTFDILINSIMLVCCLMMAFVLAKGFF